MVLLPRRSLRLALHAAGGRASREVRGRGRHKEEPERRALGRRGKARGAALRLEHGALLADELHAARVAQGLGAGRALAPLWRPRRAALRARLGAAGRPVSRPLHDGPAVALQRSNAASPRKLKLCRRELQQVLGRQAFYDTKATQMSSPQLG